MCASNEVAARQLWAGLDEAWRESFRQAWAALRAGSIAIGACASTPDGTIVHAARNRMAEEDGPHGEVFGSALAHAEVNVLARLPYRQPRALVLTSTLEPCLQCSAAIRLSPVARVRFAGADPLWDGCHDFSPLSVREAGRTTVPMTGPRADEVGLFGALIGKFGSHLKPRVRDDLRRAGHGPLLDLAAELTTAGEVARLAALEVDAAFAALLPRLRELAA
jgi:tRNA(Arg) A34 adenosine deaminase TadA